MKCNIAVRININKKALMSHRILVFIYSNSQFEMKFIQIDHQTNDELLDPEVDLDREYCHLAPNRYSWMSLSLLGLWNWHYLQIDQANGRNKLSVN